MDYGLHVFRMRTEYWLSALKLNHGKLEGRVVGFKRALIENLTASFQTSVDFAC